MRREGEETDEAGEDEAGEDEAGEDEAGEEEAGEEGAGEEDEGGEEEVAEEEEEEEEPEPAATLKSPPKGAVFKRHTKLRALLLSKYDVVWDTTQLLGWKAYDAEHEQGCKYNMCWSDTSVALERIMRMGRLQKINHFPGMLELVRKAGTARNLNKMLKACGKDYKFFPKTFMLPADYTQLKAEWAPGQNHGNKTFIVKPSAGCQGKGIYLTRKLDEIDPQDNSVVQRYLHRPHLLEGYKYDLRIYVLLSSLQPLRIFIFREGLVRVCTEKYQPVEKNLENVQMHLTNYAINKDSETFVQPEGMEDHEQEGAHKRTITSLMNTLRAEGHDVDRLWKDIGEVCVKTIISVQPHLEHTYFTCRQRSDDPGFGCFELLGFDIMMDYKLRPSLLEINHSPSFTCDSPMDTAVKTAVIRGTMEMISFSREEYKLIKRCPARLTPELREKLVRIRAEYELAHCDRLGFDILYAADRPDMDDPEVAALMARYDGLLEIAAHLYSDMSLTGSRRVTKNCGSSLAAQKPTPAGGFHADAAAAAAKLAAAAAKVSAAAAFKAAGTSSSALSSTSTKSSGAVPGAAGAGPSHTMARNARPAAGGGAAAAAKARESVNRESVSHSAPLTSPRANSARRMRDAPKSAGTRSPVRTGRAASEAGYSSSSHHHQPGSAAKGVTKPHVAAKGGAGAKLASLDANAAMLPAGGPLLDAQAVVRVGTLPPAVRGVAAPSSHHFGISPGQSHISSSVLAQLANLQSLSPRILEKMSADMSGRSDRSASGLSNGLPSQRSAGSSSTPFRASSHGHHSRSPLNPQQA